MRDTSSLISYLVMAWGLAVLGYALWEHASWLLPPLGLLGVTMAGLLLVQRRRRRLRGNWIEYVSPAVVRAGEGEFALIYHEDSQKLYFYGRQRPRPDRDVLHVPGGDDWDGEIEPWARGRREVIVGRLLDHAVGRRCEIRAIPQ